MKKNKGGLSARDKKRIDQMFENRAVLLMADKKVQVESLADMYIFLSNFTRIDFRMTAYHKIRFELIQKSIYDDYLVKIWLDENNLFHAEDVVPGKNWFVEATERKWKKREDAFGYCDEGMCGNVLD